MLEDKMLEHFKTYEFGIIPHMLLSGEYSVEYLKNHFGEISKHFFQDLDIKVSIENFFVTLHSFQFQHEPEISIVVFHFPFQKTEQYYGLAKRLYYVYSGNLKKIHLYLEVLKNVRLRCEYNIFNIHLKENIISYEFITSRDVFNEETLAGDCAIWSSAMEVNQGLLKPVPFENIKR